MHFGKFIKVIFVGFLLFGSTVYAQTERTQFEQGRTVAAQSVEWNEKEEAQIVQKVRTKSYSGGSDESDLKVQSLLVKPTRKIEPAADESDDGAEAHD